ncbi:MAG: AAA family ATPase [Patescibacteria group bacterium]
MPSLDNLVKQRLENGPIIAKGLATDSTGREYFERHMFVKSKQYVKDFLTNKSDIRWLIMIGLRGVGKSTIMAQTYLELIRNGVEKEDILYFSVDQIEVAGFTLNEVLEAFETIKGVSLEGLRNRTFILIDETQTDSNWGKILKAVFDKNKKIFIFCTGSSALELQANPDIARRSKLEKLYPLSFVEYQLIKNRIFPKKGLKNKLREALYYSDSAEECFTRLEVLKNEVDEYWSQVDQTQVEHYFEIGTLPFTATYTDTMTAYNQINGLIDRIINNDLVAIKRFDPETLKKIKQIALYLSDKDVVSIVKLAQDIKMHPITVTGVMDALVQAELIIKVPPQGSSTAKARKPAKFLFMTPNIRAALIKVYSIKVDPLDFKGCLMEDIAALHFYREFVNPGTGILTYEAAENRADFILTPQRSKPIAIEVGSGDKGTAQARNTANDRGCKYGLTINKDRLSICDDLLVVSVPHSYFLLA